MKKELIVEHLRENLQNELLKAKAAYNSSHDHATDNELKADGKYDTRAIEAGYIAGAQKKRVEELELEINLIDEIDLENTQSQVAVGSVVKLSFNGLEKLYFISSTSGGSMVKLEDEIILVISAFSPIGSQVIGLQKGDSFEVEIKEDQREYTIVEIL